MLSRMHPTADGFEVEMRTHIDETELQSMSARRLVLHSELPSLKRQAD